MSADTPLADEQNSHARWLRLMATEIRDEGHNGWGNTCDGAAAEIDRLTDKYRRAVEFLRDIASLAGTTKRKQAGCETAAHALAQLGEPRE